MENILNIIYEYSKNKQLLDEKAVIKIMDIIFNINSLNKYSYRIEEPRKGIINRNEMGCFINGTIYIFIKNLIIAVKKDSKKVRQAFSINLNEFESYLFMNLDILFTCLHETEHVLQHIKLVEYNDNTLEKKLLRIEDNFLNSTYINLEFDDIKTFIKKVKLSQLYNSNYPLSLMERLANLNALEKIKYMLLLIEEECGELNSLYQKILFYYSFKKYHNLVGPTNEFFYNIHCQKEFNEVDTRNLDEKQRIKYGLQITKDEFESQKLLLEKK